MVRAAAAVGVATLCAVVFLSTRSTQQTAATPAQPAPPWSVRESSAGFSLTWDRTLPALRRARRMELILYHNGNTSRQVLDRPSGTIVVPYTPQAAVLDVDGTAYRIRGERPQAQPAVPAAPAAKAVEPVVRVPLVLSNRRQRLVSTASIVLPRVPPYVHRRHEIELTVKVAPSGKVASVASNRVEDPLRQRLTVIASDAVSKWRFEGVHVNSLREGRIRVVFTPAGVSVRPAG